MQPLEQIKVVDLSRVLAGPSCTQMLADLGAEVIKIERPGVGDETRHWAPPKFADDTSAYFATVNRNKQSLTVDITHSEGQAILRQLIQDADIFVENFKVGNLKKYGLDYASLQALNPRLIYASLTGFGQNGEWAQKPGYDYIIQGLSGLMSITGDPNGEPQKVGVAVVDLFAGLNLTIGIQAALLARETTGLGQHIDVALLDSAITMLANVGMNYLASDKIPTRLGNAHPNIVPYQVFASSDGYFILACGNDQQFKRVCNVLATAWYQDSEYATNPQRVKHRATLIPMMQALFMTQTRDHWLTVFDHAQVPCGPINDISEAINLSQVKSRDMVVDFTTADANSNDNVSQQSAANVRVLGNPIKLSQTPVNYRTAPPKLGEHTLQILTTLGYSNEQIQQLQQDAII